MPFDPNIPRDFTDAVAGEMREQFTSLKALIPDPTSLMPLTGPATVDAVAAQLNQMLYMMKAALPPVYFHKANLPCPADGAINVPIAGLQFAWLGGQGNLYFGTVPGTWTGSVIACNSPVNVAVHLGALLPGTTYYWQVNIIGGPPRGPLAVHDRNIVALKEAPEGHASAWPHPERTRQSASLHDLLISKHGLK